MKKKQPAPPRLLQILEQSDPIDTYHHHLDACPQCRLRPFDPCPTGATLLINTARRTPNTPSRRADRHPRRISPRGRDPDTVSQREGRTPRVRSSARVPDDGAAAEPEEQIPCPMPRQHRHPQGRRI